MLAIRSPPLRPCPSPLDLPRVRCSAATPVARMFCRVGAAVQAWAAPVSLSSVVEQNPRSGPTRTKVRLVNQHNSGLDVIEESNVERTRLFVEQVQANGRFELIEALVHPAFRSHTVEPGHRDDRAG